MRAKLDEVQVIDLQNEIIKTQSDVIDELFRLLSQQIRAEELDSLPVIAMINHAAEIRREIE